MLTPPPPSYSEIDFAPVRDDTPTTKKDVKYDEKVETKGCEEDEKANITSSARSLSDIDIERAEKPKKLDLFRRRIDRSSQLGVEWGPMVLLLTYFVASTFLYVFLPKQILAIFWFIYMTTNFYIAANTVVEACLSLTPNAQARKAVQKMEENGWNFPTSNEDLPVIDIVIVAYLPNEKDIIIDRTEYAISELIYPRDKIRINIVYNTPTPMPELQHALHVLAETCSHLRVLQVPGSTSKADNINYFISLAIETDIIAIFDCDHYPHPYSPRWAAERFCQDKSVDVVQGRCVVFNAATSFLTTTVAVEFDKIYAVSHPGRASMWGFGLFCGSGGYWKADVLRDIGMDDTMLTEDIDSALRALSKNCNVIHEMNCISFELAPTTYRGLFKQRLRWAQGWTQASIKHTVLAWQKPEVGNRSLSVRAGLLSLLLVREFSYYLVTQYTCLMLNFVIIGFPKSKLGLIRLIFFQFPLSEWFFIISIVCFFIALFITNHVRSEFVTRTMMIKFTMVYPLYLMVNATIGVYGHARQAMGYSSWNPTSRR